MISYWRGVAYYPYCWV